MKTGEIKRVTVPGGSEVVCMLLPSGSYLTDCGELINLPSKGTSEKSVRLTKEQRETFKLFLDAAKSYGKLQHEVEQKNLEMQKLNQKMREEAAHLAAFNPNCSKKVFADLVWIAFPSYVKEVLEKYEFRCSITPGCGIAYSVHDNLIYLYREIMIDKYIQRKGYSFLYEEYDGTLMFVDKAEKSSSYKEVCERNRAKLSIKGCKMYETLSVGDKYSLLYTQVFSIKTPKKLTKELAKELGEKLASGMKWS